MISRLLIQVIALLASFFFLTGANKTNALRHLRKIQKHLKDQSQLQGAENVGLNIANYTSCMHLYTVDESNPQNNWNASIVEYFLKFPNGDSLARDDNFLISFASGTNAEDMMQFNYCYADNPMQDSYIISYPVNASAKTCIYQQEPNYDQGCVSYFENLSIAKKSDVACVSPYNDEEGDNYEVNIPDVVYLQYCLKKNTSLSPSSGPIPLFFKSSMSGVTMLVIFALFSDQPAPEKAFHIPVFCPQQ